MRVIARPYEIKTNVPLAHSLTDFPKGKSVFASRRRSDPGYIDNIRALARRLWIAFSTASC